MKKHIRCTGIVWRCEVADDPVEAEKRLGEVVLEVPVEYVSSALHREIKDSPGFVERKPGHVAAKAKQLGNRAHLPANVGWRTQEPFLEQPDDGLKLCDVTAVAVGVGGIQPLDVLARKATSPRHEIIAVPGQEIVALAEHDLQAVPLQFHVADDLGLQQADGVARRRIPEARQELVGNRCAADFVRRFQYGDLHPLAGQVEGAGEAIVAGADDDRILGHRISTSSSAMVGCKAIVASKSAFVSLPFTATAAAWRISGASGPIMWRPTIRSLPSSTTSL